MRHARDACNGSVFPASIGGTAGTSTAQLGKVSLARRSAGACSGSIAEAASLICSILPTFFANRDTIGWPNL